MLEGVRVNTPENANDYVVSILSVSPEVDDRFFLRRVVVRLNAKLGLDSGLVIVSCSSLHSALCTLRRCPFDVVVCERYLQPGSWKNVMDQMAIRSEPPCVIVTSRLANAQLWYEALNWGAFDLISKPFDNDETMRVLTSAWRARNRRPRKALAVTSC